MAKKAAAGRFQLGTGATDERKGVSKYLAPEVINKIEKLKLDARFVVEGFKSGSHRSPYHGFSVEFAQHREYVPGDDVKHVDWKVYFKSGRLMVKQYEEETNFVCNILHDSSESMKYTSSGKMTKLEYANFLTSSLAYLIVGQQDSVGVGIFTDELVDYLSPKQSQMHVHNISRKLEDIESKDKTDIAKIMKDFSDRMSRRGLVVIISDLLVDAKQFSDGLNRLRSRRHEIIVFQTLDHYELTFPFDGMVRFKGLEGYTEDLLCQPRMLRQAYLEALAEHQLEIRKACERNNVDLRVIDTQDPLEVALQSYLIWRLMRTRAR
ncbi:MAG TPA: DUF58 domain-containing protein [Planctomycetota bacterium]|nr:DUF58 domain-containing protein [Planctomycetota bacterium]